MDNADGGSGFTKLLKQNTGSLFSGMPTTFDGTTWTTPSTTYYDSGHRIDPTSTINTTTAMGLTGSHPGGIDTDHHHAFAVNFSDTSNQYASGFSIGISDLVTSYGGIAAGNSIATWAPTTTYSDSGSYNFNDPTKYPIGSTNTIGGTYPETFAVNFMDNPDGGDGFAIGYDFLGSGSLFSGMPDEDTIMGTTWTNPSTEYQDNYTFNIPTTITNTTTTAGITGSHPGGAPTTYKDAFTVNFSDTPNQYASGFTIGLGNSLVSQFIGIPSVQDGTYTNPGSYFDSVSYSHLTIGDFNSSNLTGGVTGSSPGGIDSAHKDGFAVNFMGNTATVPESAAGADDAVAARGDIHAKGFTLSGVDTPFTTQFVGVGGDDGGGKYEKPASIKDDPHTVNIGFPNTQGGVSTVLGISSGQALTFNQQTTTGGKFMVGGPNSFQINLVDNDFEWDGFAPDIKAFGNTQEDYDHWKTKWNTALSDRYIRLPELGTLPNNRILPMQAAADILSSMTKFGQDGPDIEELTMFDSTVRRAVGSGPDSQTAGSANALTIGRVISDPIFIATQFLLQFHNARNQKVWNPLSLASGIPIGPLKIGISRGNFFGFFNTGFAYWEEGGGTETYINTVAELAGARDTDIGTGNIGATSHTPYFKSIATKTNAWAPNSERDDNTSVTLGMKFSGGVAYQVLGVNKVKATGDSGTFPTSLLDVAPGLIHPTLGILGDLVGAAASRVVPGWDGVQEFLNNYSATRAQYVTRDKTYKTDKDGLGTSNIQEQTDGLTAANKLGKRIIGTEDNSFGSFSSLKRSLTNIDLGNYSTIPETGGTTYSSGLTEATYTSEQSLNGYTGTVDESFTGDTTITRKGDVPANRRFGDLHTILNPLPKAYSLAAAKDSRSSLSKQYNDLDAENIESPKYGMPMYFKDLRDNRYITFRAYLTGLAENITPTWNTTEYIGRSEPVYRYQSTQREVNFTLTLFAHTRDEFEVIMMKLNRITSMCYPEYMKDETMAINSNLSKIRMKPPLVKLRIGEWLGNMVNDGVTGYIQTLSTTIPEEAPWETEQGMRVPKMFQLTFQYKVIHGEVPALIKGESMSVPEAQLDYTSYQQFYGFDGYTATTSVGA